MSTASIARGDDLGNAAPSGYPALRAGADHNANNITNQNAIHNANHFTAYLPHVTQTRAERPDAEPGPEPGPGLGPGPLHSSRSQHTATLLGDGRLLVVGGNGFVGTTELYDPRTEEWSLTAPPSTARYNHTATRLLDGRVLVAGGRVDNGHGTIPTELAEIYDPATESWSPAASLPQPSASHAAALMPDGRVLVVGGYTGTPGGFTAEARIYMPDRDVWAAAPPASEACSLASATVLSDGHVLVAGGFEGSESFAVSELFDPATDTWSVTGSMNTPRSDHTATLLLDGTLLVTGGLNGRPGDMAELYEPATGTWLVLPDPQLQRYWHTATMLEDGTVLVAGGTSLDGMAEFSESFDPTIRSWVQAAPLTWARSEHTATLIEGAGVLVVGGVPASWYRLREVYPALAESPLVESEQYHAPADGWRTASSAPSGRIAHTLTTLDDGSVLLAGGTGVGGTLDGVALFSPGTDSWVPAAPMGSVRTVHSATRLPDGSVLVAGGATTHGVTASAEVFDPETGSWQATDSLAQARYGHSATTVPNGDVLVVGGYGGVESDSAAVATSERFVVGSGTWRTAGSLETPVCEHSATLLDDGAVLITGGLDDCQRENPVAHTWRFDPVTESWSVAAQLPTARFNHSSVLLDDGRVLVFGGQVPSRRTRYTTDVWLYDPVADQWSDAAPTSGQRDRHTTAVLGDGTVWAIGGQGGPAAARTTSTVEIFQPATQTWSAGAQLAESRMLHASAILPDGRIMVAGGATFEDTAAKRHILASVELYDPSTSTWSAGPPLPAYR